MTLKLKRGTTAQVAAITPETGEPVLDTTLNQVSIGDGATAGGNVLIPGVPANDVTEKKYELNVPITGDATWTEIASGDASSRIFYGERASGTATSGVITFGGTPITDTGFSENTGVIIVANEGRYRISFVGYGTIINPSGSGKLTEIIQRASTGGGFSTIQSTDIFIQGQTLSAPLVSSVIITLAASDEIRFQLNADLGGGTGSFRLDNSNYTIEPI